jgi:two-component system, LytTR family, sensor kinase
VARPAPHCSRAASSRLDLDGSSYEWRSAVFAWFRWRTWFLGLGVFTIIGSLMFVRYAMDVVARGGTIPLERILVEEVTAAFGAALLFPWVIHFARRYPLDRRGWLGRVPSHLGNVVAVSALHTTWNWISREALFPVMGLGDYDYGRLLPRYAMELPIDLLWYSSVVGFVYLFDHFRASREREIQVAQLETRLARAQLQSLQAQLNPHFLFNALNTVSSVMYEDVARADRMLSDLAELLRRALHTSGRQEVSLAEELEVLALFFGLMRARFGERLLVSVDVDERVREALVPTLILQPLVENAMRHGAPPPPEPARIVVRAREDAGELVLEVEDNGPGLNGVDAPVGRGHGLTNTAERLRALYGGAQSLVLENAPGSGLRVVIRIPLRRAAADQSDRTEEAWTASAC